MSFTHGFFFTIYELTKSVSELMVETCYYMKQLLVMDVETYVAVTGLLP